jgi:hypothetical protein
VPVTEKLRRLHAVGKCNDSFAFIRKNCFLVQVVPSTFSEILKEPVVGLFTLCRGDNESERKGFVPNDGKRYAICKWGDRLPGTIEFDELRERKRFNN